MWGGPLLPSASRTSAVYLFRLSLPILPPQSPLAPDATMRVFPLVPLLTAAAAAVAAVPTAAEKTKGVSEALFARFVHFLTISQACYAGDACNLRGLPRVASILNTTTDIHGWVLRDDATREIVVAFRGTSSDVNSRANANYTLGDVETLPQCAGCKAHGGYYVNWVSVFEQVKGLVKDAAAKWPTYGIVVTGHRYVVPGTRVRSQSR